MGKWIAGGVLGLVAILALTFGLGLFGLEYERFFRPRMEEVRRETFEQSQSRVQGQISYLNRLRNEMARATTDEQKCAVRATALHEASLSTPNTLPSDIEAWVNEIRRMAC